MRKPAALIRDGNLHISFHLCGKTRRSPSSPAAPLRMPRSSGGNAEFYLSVSACKAMLRAKSELFWVIGREGSRGRMSADLTGWKRLKDVVA
jgi:hypothetical protein